MENLDLNNQTLMIIGGVVLVLIILILFLVRRKKKNGAGEGSAKQNKKTQKVEGKKYKGEDPSDEQLAGASKLVIDKFDDSPKSLSFRFKIKGPKIKLDEIDPYDNSWISIMNYNDLVGQVRSDGDLLHVFMNRKERYRPSHPENAVINVVYRQDGGKQWIQQIKYNSKSGVELGALKTLN